MYPFNEHWAKSSSKGYSLTYSTASSGSFRKRWHARKKCCNCAMDTRLAETLLPMAAPKPAAADSAPGKKVRKYLDATSRLGALKETLTKISSILTQVDDKDVEEIGVSLM